MLQQKQLITIKTALKAANDDLLAMYSKLTNEEQKILAIVINSTIKTMLKNRGEQKC